MASILCNFYSDKLKKNANVRVFLPTVSPDDYLFGNGTTEYPMGAKYQTLYLLHGSYGDFSDWARLTCVERYAQDCKLAVVMPSGENSCYLNMEYGEAYLDYIGQELPGFLEKMFPLSKKREDRFIAGLSMGGYGACRIALEYPLQYSYVASISGALDMQALQNCDAPHIKKMPLNYRQACFKDLDNIVGSRDDLQVLIKQRVEQKCDLPTLYMCCGAQDFVLPTNEAFYETAKSLGATIQFDKDDGAHDWDYWDAHIRSLMQILPIKKKMI